MDQTKVYIAYYSTVHDSDGGYYVDWCDKEIISVYSTLELLNEKIKDDISKLGGHFFIPGPELTRWLHPTEDVFYISSNDCSYVWNYEEANFITELDIFK